MVDCMKDEAIRLGDSVFVKTANFEELSVSFSPILSNINVYNCKRLLDKQIH